ncbi:hypothetical protein B0H19DRAFT_1160143 [Mycena capillaripes]|nr:hypothetical protein B0H19DRAFT_1160143 [Mycena capillaripes]
MYTVVLTLALCLSASALPAFKNRQFLNRAIAGDATGIACTPGNGCFNGDVVTCVNGEFVVSQPCAAPTTCLVLPLDNSQTDEVFTCATTADQTALFGVAFGGVDKIPTD